MPFDPGLVACSTITLRHLPLHEALAAIVEQGFTHIDLGALPGVCDHVPVPLDDEAVARVAETVQRSGLIVVSVNADVGSLNEPPDTASHQARRAHVERLLTLCAALGHAALVLPNGRQDHAPFISEEADTALVAAELDWIHELARERGLALWVEAPHLFRFHHTIQRSEQLYRLLDPAIGAVLDTSHIVASGGTVEEFVERFGERIAHVHIRDASEGYIHHSVGRGTIDFPAALTAIAASGYQGHLSLELETRDTENEDRARVARETADFISASYPTKETTP